MWRAIKTLMPFRSWLILALIIMCLLALLSMRSACTAGEDTRQAEATGKALDRVAEKTPAIRQDQKEREDEVDEIEGADQPLPDGFGAELERVRRRDRNTR